MGENSLEPSGNVDECENVKDDRGLMKFEGEAMNCHAIDSLFFYCFLENLPISVKIVMVLLN